MASELCTDWWARSYIGAWNGWTNNFNLEISDGYCYASGSSTTYAYCFYFKTPKVSWFHKSTRIDFMIPVIRTSSSFAKSGELYFKLLESDPTGGSITSNLKPTKDSCDASYAWSISDQQVHKIYFSISTGSLKSNTGYYITVSGNKLLGIGYLGYTPAGGWWSATLNYETYTNVTANKPVIIDNKNSTFNITTRDGTAGTNNSVKSTSLYYRIGSSGEYTKHSSKSITNKALTCADSSKSQWVYAYSVVDGTHNDAKTDEVYKEIPNYVAPGKPGIPELTEASYKNGRLTVKQNWTFTWTAAIRANDNSYVKGYRVRIMKNGSAISGLVYSEQDTANIISNGTNANNYIDCENTNCIIKFDPVDLGFKPGDTVSVGIYAYTRDGAGTLLFNGGGQSEDQVVSVVSTIQNAGIVNVKAAGKWVEGQVWVKANNTWHEAETVNVKVNGAWRESQ